MAIKKFFKIGKIVFLILTKFLQESQFFYNFCYNLVQINLFLYQQQLNAKVQLLKYKNNNLEEKNNLSVPVGLTKTLSVSVFCT